MVKKRQGESVQISDKNLVGNDKYLKIKDYFKHECHAVVVKLKLKWEISTIDLSVTEMATVCF